MFRWFLRMVLLATVALAVCSLPGSALALRGGQNVAGLIKKGQNFFDDQRYEESTQTLSAALLRPEIKQAEKIEVYKLLAFNYILLGKQDEADGAVRGLLVTDETFELPKSESPRFREFFSTSRKRWVEEGRPGLKASEASGGEAPKATVKLRHSSPAQVSSNDVVPLSGELDDSEGAVSQVRLYFRQGSSGKFESLKARYAMRRFSVDLPASVVAPPLVEYYLVALDNKGIPVATRGDAESPLRIAVPESQSVITSPWLWVPVGVAVVAAIVIPIVVVSAQTSSADVTIRVTE